MDRLISPICPEFAEAITQTNQVYVLSKQNDMGFMNSRQDDIIRIVKLRTKHATTNQARTCTSRAWRDKLIGF